MNITHTLEVIRDRELHTRSKIASINEQNMMESVDDRFNEVESLLSKETVGDYMEANDTIKQMDVYTEASVPNGIVKKIYDIPKLRKLSGCKDSHIKDAEKELNVKFPKEYIDYVKEFGAISFYGTELTGLNVKGHTNVVEATNQEKSVNAAFPKNCFVLENSGIGSRMIISDGSGKVYSLKGDKKDLLCDSITEYLDECIKRKK